MSMSDRDGIIWRDGEMIDWREAGTHVLTHTLHYGAGVFEGVRAYDGKQGTAIFRLQDHTKRLLNSAKIIGMKVPYSQEELNQAQVEVVKANDMDYGYIRPMCFYGSEGMGLRADNLKVHCIVAAWEWGAYMGKECLENGIRVKTSSFTRHHVNATMCKAKVNGHYVNSMLALQEATQDGYDEALLLDPQGFVAEGSGENVFIVRDGVLYTPELSSALDGITRKTIIGLADEMDLPVVEKQISRDEVYIADEAFFTGTAAEVTPIRELDNRPIGAGTRGPITQDLQSKYFKIVHGEVDEHAHWLTPAN
ncbi:MAG: branched-chain amino acid transaminase [Gammaproteobacteria bacterium]